MLQRTSSQQSLGLLRLSAVGPALASLASPAAQRTWLERRQHELRSKSISPQHHFSYLNDDARSSDSCDIMPNNGRLAARWM